MNTISIRLYVTVSLHVNKKNKWNAQVQERKACRDVQWLGWFWGEFPDADLNKRRDILIIMITEMMITDNDNNIDDDDEEHLFT